MRVDSDPSVVAMPEPRVPARYSAGEHARVRVVLAEDELLMRRGLELVLSGTEFEITAELSTADALMQHLEQLAHGTESAKRDASPLLVITDIRMPPSHTDEGMVAARSIRRRWPHIAVCVLSQHVMLGPARRLLAAASGSPAARGGMGYLLKQRISEVGDFHADLRRIVAGDEVIDPAVLAALTERPDVADAIAGLTPRQRELVMLVASGRSNSGIAAELFITEKSVVQHLTRIYKRFGLTAAPDEHRRVQAVLAWLDNSAP